LLALSLLVPTLVARPAAAETPYDAGHVRLTAILGNTSYAEANYFIAGLGVGYFLADGLEIGAEGDYWIGGPPTVARLSPEVRYILWFVPEVQPYVGAFYRHRFISGYADQDTAGGQLGVLWGLGAGYVGIGAVYERLLTSCTSGCDVIYPEVTAALSF